MSFDAHVKEVSSKVFSRLRSLWPSYNTMSWKTRLMLLKSLILPVFTYCDSVYSTNLTAKSVRVLERAFSACIRYVFGIGRRDSINDYINRVVGCPIMEFMKYRRLVLVFKLLKSNSPEYLFRNFNLSSRSNLVIIPRHSTSQYNKSFFVSAVSMYNSLPNAVKQSSSVVAFKRLCFEHLFPGQ